MAFIPYGITGQFIGSAGNVTGYVIHGKNFIRSKRRKSDKPMTAARLAQQQKIKVCNAFTAAFSGTGFLNITFPSYGRGGSGYNRATSALMNQAVTGSYPNLMLSWPKVLVSHGPLPAAEFAGVAAHADGTIFFNWTDNSGTGTAKPDDKVVLAAYCPSLKQVIVTSNAGYRKDCLASLAAKAFKGHAIETWIGFTSNDEKNAADSVYTGSLSL